MARLTLALLLLLVACGTEPKSPTLDGYWTGSAAGHSMIVLLTQDGSSLTAGSINVSSGPLCSQVGGPGMQTGNGTVSFYFFDCIQPSTVSTISFTGTLSGDTMTGTLSGWSFNNTPVTLTR